MHKERSVQRGACCSGPWEREKGSVLTDPLNTSSPLIRSSLCLTGKGGGGGVDRMEGGGNRVGRGVKDNG